jgi:hypothetical protein
MSMTGPSAFERTYALEGSLGEHEPQIIGRIVARMVSVKGALIGNSAEGWWPQWCRGPDFPTS